MASADDKFLILPDGIDPQRLRRLLALAREEDLGPHGDLSTALLAPDAANQTAAWHLVARRPGCACGAALLPFLLAELAPQVRADALLADGSELRPGARLAH